MLEDSDGFHASLPISVASTPMEASVMSGEVTVHSTARDRLPLGNVDLANAVGCLGKTPVKNRGRKSFRKDVADVAAGMPM
jgi:hypothetical protein